MGSRHKGIERPAVIDRDWPHQVALHDDLCCMENFDTIRDWLAGNAAPARTQRIEARWPNGVVETYRLHCFRELSEAQAFIAVFGGVTFDPRRDRGKGRLRHQWERSDTWSSVLESGPLRVPDILR